MAAAVRHQRRASARAPQAAGFRGWERPTPPAAIAAWTRQLALLLRAGVSLASALEAPALARPAGWSEGDVRTLARARLAITRGAGFAEALARHVSALDPFALQTLAAAELTGALDRALERIAVRTERRDTLRRTVQRALLYPAIVVIVAVGAVVALLVFVIPVFAGIFAEFGEALPLPTRAVIALSDWTMRTAPVAMPLAGVGLAVLAGALRRNPQAKRRLDAAVLSLPWFGAIVRAGAVADAMETLAGLVGGGIPLFEALPVAAQTAANGRIADALVGARQRIAEGSALAEALGRDPVVPALAVQMIAVGEQSGALDTVLDSVARIFREEADRRTATLLALLEPAIVLVLAGGVGGVVVAMYLPIFRLGAVVG